MRAHTALVALAIVAAPELTLAQTASPETGPGSTELAEPKPAEPPDPAPDSDVDMSEIEAATGADAATIDQTRKPSGPSAASAAWEALNPDLTVIVDVGLAFFTDEDHLQTGGHDPLEQGFNLQAVELALGKAVDPYFRLDAVIVLTLGEIEIEEAYATTLDLPWDLQGRLGQMPTKIGRLNPTHPHQWDFVDQPFALGMLFGPEGNRGVGAELSWLAPLPWYTEVIAAVIHPGEAHAHGDEPEVPAEEEPDSRAVQPTLVIEQFVDLSPNWSLLVGLSGASLFHGDEREHLAGADLYLKYRPITWGSDTVVALQAEWFVKRLHHTDGKGTDRGGYGQLFWRFARRWGTAVRYEHGRSHELDDADRHRASASLTFWPTEFSRVRLQGSLDAPAWRDDPIGAAFLAFEFIAGAHGAHEF